MGFVIDDKRIATDVRNDNGNTTHYANIGPNFISALNWSGSRRSPPIGLNLFIISSIGGVGVIDIFKQAVPYFLILVGVLLIITFIPSLTLFLPELVFRD